MKTTAELYEYKKQERIKKTIQEKVKKINRALEHLRFAEYIVYLEQLGKLLNKLFLANQLSILEKFRDDEADINVPVDSKAIKLRWAASYLEQIFPEKVILQNTLAFRAFEEAWLDEHFKKGDISSNVKSQRSLTVKAHLNLSTRHHIKFGMYAFAYCSRGQLTPETDIKKVFEYDAKAAKAIANYRTRRQIILDTVGSSLALIMAIACGIATGAGVLMLAITAWPLTVALVVGGLAGIFVALANWSIFKNAVPAVLRDIFGKDKLFEGWTKYIDDNTGKKVELSRTRKIALGLSSVLAASVGLFTGILFYTFPLSIPLTLGKIALFSFLASGVAGSIFPPVAIAFAAIAFVCITALMIKAFASLLKTKDWKEVTKKLFKPITDLFDPEAERNKGKSARRLKIEKVITYALVGIIAVASLYGLGNMQWLSAVALEPILQTMTHLAPAVAMAVTASLSLSIAFIGQVPFVLDSAVKAFATVKDKSEKFFSQTAKFFSKLFKQPKPQADLGAQVMFPNQVNGVIESRRQVGVRVLESSKNIFYVVSNVVCAVGSGALVVPSLLIRHAGIPIVGAAFATATFNSFSSSTASSYREKQQEAQNASTARINQLLKAGISSDSETDEIEQRADSGMSDIVISSQSTMRYRYFEEHIVYRQSKNTEQVDEEIPRHIRDIRNC